MGAGESRRRAGAREREAAFHDRLADEGGPEPAPPRRSNWWERSLLEAAQPLAGARVLELGCGDGELTFKLVDGGAAELTAVDISPAMVRLARARLRRFRPEAPVRFLEAPAEETGLEPEGIDLVVGKWVLHHLDLDRAAEEVHRLLRPGGRGVFIETSAYNPLLALGRTHLPALVRLGIRRYGTVDERPLSRRDVRMIGARFSSVRVDHPDFFLLHIFDRNVLGFRSQRWTRRFLRWDEAIGRRAPFLGPLSYYLRLTLVK